MLPGRNGRASSNVLEEERGLVRSRGDALLWAGTAAAGGCVLLITSLFLGNWNQDRQLKVWIREEW